MPMKILILLSLILLFTVPLHADEPDTGKMPVYRLSVTLDPGDHRLTGIAKISLPKSDEHTVFVGALKINRVVLDGKQINAEIQNGIFTSPGGSHLSIEYEGIFQGSDVVEDVENVGVVTEGLISEEGISLTGLWYPAVESEADAAVFNLEATLPEGFKAVSEADIIKETPEEGATRFSFLFSHPLQGITLAGGKYEVKSAKAGDVDVYTYFFGEDRELAATYLEYAVNYIKMYEELLGPFPFKRFSVVENFQPTGYSMPTYTLLGKRVVRLPFIVETSLGHEIVHQWFGNSVYIDYESGNWAEGLTTYLSDHLYDELKGKGAEHRKKLLSKYRSFVRRDNDFPLTEFFQRSGLDSAAVGYGKTAMVFHMLKNEIGEEAFNAGLKNLSRDSAFRRASWSDIRSTFEAASEKKLDWFFDQWTGQTGALEISISPPQVVYLEGKYQVTFTVGQRGTPYKFLLPVSFVTSGGTENHTFRIEKKSREVYVELTDRPQEMIVDEGYDLMRRLSQSESPPVIDSLLGAKNRLAVLPPDEEEAGNYEPLTNILRQQGFTVKAASEVKDEDLVKSSVLVMGFDHPVLKRLFGHRPQAEGDTEPEGFIVITLKNPFAPRLVVTGVHSSHRTEAVRAAHKIFRYGSYSILRFVEGRNTEKTISPADNGFHIKLEHTVTGIIPSRSLSFDEIMARIIDTPVIYVGEGHPNYEDHKVQLRVIQELHDAGHTLAVGMEMFQRPFQEPLDQYIAGDIDERQFLLDSEYYKRWKFNYHLYREILDFCRLRGIPVLALNQKAEVIRKVSRQGFDSLTDEEREMTPPDMDLSDLEYKNRLAQVFRAHNGQAQSQNLNNFYQAQVLWDETMAHTIADYLSENQGTQMVVVAGAGHIVFGSGIPSRAHRLTGLDYVTLVPSSSGSPLEPDVADFIYYAEPVQAPQSPLIGVMLDTEEGRLSVKSVNPGSPAEKAGIKEGDIFITADGLKVKGIEDLKVALFGKRPGESVTIRMLRPRFILKDKELEFKVTF